MDTAVGVIVNNLFLGTWAYRLDPSGEFIHSFIHIRLLSVVKTQPNMN